MYMEEKQSARPYLQFYDAKKITKMRTQQTLQIKNQQSNSHFFVSITPH